MNTTVTIASLVGLLIAVLGFVRWVYKRGRKEGEGKANEKAVKSFHQHIIDLVNNPNHLFKLRSKDNKD